MKKFRAGLVAVAAIGCVIAMGNPAYAAEPFTLMFGQQTATTSEARSYFIPKALGFFKEEGIDVTLQPTDGATAEMQILAAGKGDAGLGAPPAILLARNAGAKIRAIFMTGREHGTSIAVLANGPIQDPKDLKGKKIGVMSMGASRTLDGYAMAQAAGLDPKTDVQWLPVGFGVQAGLALQRGDVQALALWDITYADMEANGIKMRYYTFPFQKNIFGYVYATTDEKLATRRADIIKVVRSNAKAEIFERASVEAAACVYLIEIRPLGGLGRQGEGLQEDPRRDAPGFSPARDAGRTARHLPTQGLGDRARLLLRSRRHQAKATGRRLLRERPCILCRGQRLRPLEDRSAGAQL